MCIGAAPQVSVVKDPTSDIAQLARKGSALLKEVREQQERQKMKKKFWELGGTVMGSLIGVEKSAEDKAAEAAEGGAELNEDGSVDFKHSNQVCAFCLWCVCLAVCVCVYVHV